MLLALHQAHDGHDSINGFVDIASGIPSRMFSISHHRHTLRSLLTSQFLSLTHKNNFQKIPSWTSWRSLHVIFWEKWAQLRCGVITSKDTRFETDDPPKSFNSATPSRFWKYRSFAKFYRTYFHDKNLRRVFMLSNEPETKISWIVSEISVLKNTASCVTGMLLVAQFLPLPHLVLGFKGHEETDE